MRFITGALAPKTERERERGGKIGKEGQIDCLCGDCD